MKQRMLILLTLSVTLLLPGCGSAPAGATPPEVSPPASASGESQAEASGDDRPVLPDLQLQLGDGIRADSESHHLLLLKLEAAFWADVSDELPVNLPPTVRGFLCHDFDGDGTEEAFALVNNKLWYLSEHKAEFLHNKTAFEIYEGQPYLIQTGGKAFAVLLIQESTAGSPRHYIWAVTDDTPYEVNLSGGAGVLQANVYGEVTMQISSYGAYGPVGEGRTTQHYCLFWDGKAFREYGAIPIGLDALFTIPGAEELVEPYLSREAVWVDSVLYRGNGVVHINYCTGNTDNWRNEFLTLRILEDGSVRTENYGDGHCEEAIRPDLAVYPSAFGQRL